MIKIKRVYDPLNSDDGFRILVDRLWPRGLSKDKAEIDLWLKDIAPSNELRRWLSHDPEKWEVFKRKYAEELKPKTHLLSKIRQIEKEKRAVTLLYSAKNREYNNAVALNFILQKVSKRL